MNLKPITEIAAQLGIAPEHLELYGKLSAKVSLDVLKGKETKGKLILITATTPTTSGEGKTTVSIGLAQALVRLGKKAVATLREPSLGPVFGMKGGATGGGASMVHPSEKINLHFNGDFHALTSAHNLLAAMMDAHIHNGNALKLDVNNLLWPRCMDMNDRALRQIVVGCGGKTNGPARETGFVITAASEIMAILALAADRDDLKRRLGNIVVGFDTEGKPVTAQQLGAVGAMSALLAEAILPNLVQTTEGVPAFIHAGPFANIAHGTCSVIAQRMGMAFAEYAINETGFAADLGAQKYFDVVMPQAGIKPSVAVIIATVKSLANQGAPLKKDEAPTSEQIAKGTANLGKHIANMKRYGVPVVVAVNRFPKDTDEQLQQIVKFSESIGTPAAVVEVFQSGGAGAEELAKKVIAAAESVDLNKVHSFVPLDMPLEKKIEAVAKEVYGAEKVVFENAAKKKLEKFTTLGHGNKPVCMAKTQYSLSDNVELRGAPTGWTLKVTDAFLSAGAGFVVVTLGDMMLMPGLGKTPAALKIDTDAAGNITGLS